jgi:hypothetical protein
MSLTRLTIPRDQILLAKNKHTNKSRQIGEKEDYSTKAKSPSVEGVSQETHEVEKNSKVADKKK